MNYIFNILKFFFWSRALPPTLLFFGNLFLYRTALVYEGNADFFYFNLREFSFHLLSAFFLFSILFSLPAAGKETRKKKAYTAAWSSLAITSWVNASFFAGSRGLLDGKTFEVISSFSYKFLNSTVWVVLLAVIFFLGVGRFRGLIRSFTIFLVLIIFFHSGWIVYKDKDKKLPSSKSFNISQFSKNENILIILLDTYQNDFFEEILKNDPELEKDFDGFIYYKNAVGVAPTTYLSIPSIHSGCPYEKNQSINQMYKQRVHEGSFLTRFYRSGYQTFLLNPVKTCPKGITCGNEKIILKGNRSFYFDELSMIYDFSLFRVVPHFWRKRIYKNGRWYMNRKYKINRHALGLDVLNEIGINLKIEDAPPVIKFLHLYTTHAPIYYNKFCKLTRIPYNRESAIGQAHCVTRKLALIPKIMKQKGIFNNTTLLIFSDHGAGLPKAGGSRRNSNASPLLLIKPSQSSGKLRRSNELVSLLDIPATICAGKINCKTGIGRNILAKARKIKTSYPYFNYNWKHKFWKLDQIPLEGIYLVNGPPNRNESWKRTGFEEIVQCGRQ